MNRVAVDAVAPQPWKNGGGRTRELLAWPRPDDWSLRVSVADIDADGPFSPWPGVRRWFAVLQGAGVVLDFESGPRSVHPGDEPIDFDGAEAPGCRLLDGPTRDLNLMLRRGTGSLRRARPGERVDGTAFGAVFASGVATLERGGTSTPLAPWTLAWWQGGTARLDFDPAAARAWWIAFDDA